nr:MAG TPA: hypothetical protein [Caudoviricetes sp.]
MELISSRPEYHGANSASCMAACPGIAGHTPITTASQKKSQKTARLLRAGASS